MIFINLFGKYTGASHRPRDVVVNIFTECKPMLIIFRAICSSQSVLINSVMYNSINRPRANSNYNLIFIRQIYWGKPQTPSRCCQYFHRMQADFNNFSSYS